MLELNIYQVKSDLPHYDADIAWLLDSYYAAVNEEKNNTPADKLRTMNPNKKDQVVNMLKEVSSLQDLACIYIAKVGEERIAYFVGVLKYSAGEDPQYVGYINGLYVLPSKRNLGVASQLVKVGYQWFREKNISIVELYSNINNQAGIKFWQKRGFVAVEQVMLAKLQ